MSAQILLEGGRRYQTALLRKLAHDLAGATAVARGALDEYTRAPADGQRHMLDVAQRSVGRLERITRRMRLSALIDEDGLKIIPEVAPLDVIVEQAAQEATRLDTRKSVSVEVVQSPQAARVQVDVGLAVAAIAEHISNAIRFARHKVRVEQRAGDTHGIVEITDDGPGFATEYVEAVSTRGWRNLSPKAALSLGIALELVERLGGRTEVGVGEPASPGDAPGARVVLRFPRVPG